MKDQFRMANTPKDLTRIAIVIYVSLLAIGIFDGVDLSRLSIPFVGFFAPILVTKGITLVLCALVFFKMLRRYAGIAISIIIFAASYQMMLEGSPIVGFWSDLALIAALLWSTKPDFEWSDCEVVGDNDLELAAMLPEEPPVDILPVKRRATVSRFREDFSLAQID